MKLTRDRFRIKIALGAVLLGGVMLPMVDWSYFAAALRSPIATLNERHHRWIMRDKGTPLTVAALLITVGVGLLVEFESDPKPRKDPWEEEPTNPENE